MEQDQNLEKIRQYARSTVATVLDSETKDEVMPNKIVFSQNVENKTVQNNDTTAPLFVQKTQQTQNEQNTKTDAQKLQEIKEKIAQKQEDERQEETKEQNIENQQPSEQSLDNLFSKSLEIEETKDEQIDEQLNQTKNQKPKNSKFRFRLLSCVFACLVAITGGWIIGNIIEISQTSTQISEVTTSNSKYSADILKLLNNIRKLDNTDTTVPNPEDGSLLPIEEFIQITPDPLEDVTEYQKESNWFDKICNFIKNLFGG